MSQTRFNQLLTVLTCHSLEDFPVHLVGEQAASLHACWTAPWHPTLLQQAATLPGWSRPDQIPELTGQSLVLVPLSSTNQFPLSPNELTSHPATFILSPLSRQAIWNQLGLPLKPAAPQPANLANQITADDFAALGYAYLQLQLLTRRLRYSNTLDESNFSNAVLAAADAFIKLDQQNAEANLNVAFDLLLSERNRYYPIDARLIELLLLDQTHFPQTKFVDSRKVNLLLDLDAAQSWWAERPELIHELAIAAQSGKLQILGSTQHILKENFLPSAGLLFEYISGKQTFEKLFGISPTVFGRRNGDLHPCQPQILSSLGYRGALHLPLNPNQKLPPTAAATLAWQGLGQYSLDAITSTPIDANSSNAFLGLALEIGRQMDSAHDATVVLVHWPNQSCESFEDLTRVARRSSLLGRFVTCDELFDALYHASYGDCFDYDDYRSNPLSQSATEGRVNPISTAVECHALHSQWLALRHLNTMLAILNPENKRLDQQLAELLPSINQLSSAPLATDAEHRQIQVRAVVDSLSAVRQSLKATATASLFQSAPRVEEKPRPAVGLVNPSFSARRLWSAFSCTQPDSLPEISPPVILSDHNDRAGAVVVDVPASGFAIISCTGGQSKRRQPPMVVDQTIRNEFFELEIDPQTGGIRRLRTHGSRTTLLSQQLAVLVDQAQETDQEPLAGFARMVATKVSFDSTQPLLASCHSTGTLQFGSEAWADFRQQLSVTRGLRTIEFEIEIELHRELGGLPWKQYVCSRLAWGDEPLGRYRGLHDTHQAVRLEKFIAPSYIHIDNGHVPLTLFSDGLAYHRQSQLRVLDTLLIVQREQARRFRFAIGVGIEHPHLTASQRLSNCLTIPLDNAVATQQRLFHLACKNLLVVDSAPTFAATGTCTGAILRFRETAGNNGQAILFAPAKLKGAKVLDLTGKPLEALPTKDDQVILEYHGFKLFTLQLFW